MDVVVALDDGDSTIMSKAGSPVVMRKPSDEEEYLSLAMVGMRIAGPEAMAYPARLQALGERLLALPYSLTVEVGDVPIKHRGGSVH